MFSITRPTEAQINQFIIGQSVTTFSYPHVGATRGELPAGYIVDHNRVQLGQGREVFSPAKAALRQWQMFQIPWLKLCWPNAPIAVGTTVVVSIHALGLWSLNPCRIIYTIDDTGPTDRFGFAYGTLPSHAERGEERFSVEWHHADNTVWYDLLAFSTPNQLFSKIAFPYVRRLQKRFAVDSKRAMQQAVGPKAKGV